MCSTELMPEWLKLRLKSYQLTAWSNFEAILKKVHLGLNADVLLICLFVKYVMNFWADFNETLWNNHWMHISALFKTAATAERLQQTRQGLDGFDHFHTVENTVMYARLWGWGKRLSFPILHGSRRKSKWKLIFERYYTIIITNNNSNTVLLLII